MDSKFDFLISKYSRDLTKLCISLCSSFTDAEDLFQETWCKVFKNYNQYDSTYPFEKWLFSICVNIYKDSLKLHYNSKRFIFKSEEEKEKFFYSIPYEKQENTDDYSELHKAIALLSKKQKIIVILYYFKGYTNKEIAEILNISEGTVKSRMHTAKKAIKRRLINEKE